MNQASGIEFERRVAEAIAQLNYNVTTEPTERPQQSTWQDRISSWLVKPSPSLPSPDMFVELGEKMVVVEAKAYPILLGSVIQTKHYADYFGASAILCVPDDVFHKVPNSVREWAEANDVVLSPIGEIGDKLKMLL